MTANHVCVLCIDSEMASTMSWVSRRLATNTYSWTSRGTCWKVPKTNGQQLRFLFGCI